MPKHVLFLEDTPEMAEFVGKKLTEAGITYDHFENPRIALRTIGKNPQHYDAVVSDWNMPAKNGRLSMNGDDFLNTIRFGATEDFGIPQDIPFVMCSANDDMDKIDKIMEAGADFYQIKFYGKSLQPMINYLNTL